MNAYERVVDYCKRNKMSVYEFEKMCNIGNGTIGKWKHKLSDPSFKTLLKITKATSTEIVYWVGDPHD